MNIVQQDNRKKGVFSLMDEDRKAGEITYTWAGEDKLIIDHTEVFEGFEGKGIGKQLVMMVVEMAREKGIKILPLCPYAKTLFDKTPALLDVLF
jgi:predicted GNAT family acetyltransferase